MHNHHHLRSIILSSDCSTSNWSWFLSAFRDAPFDVHVAGNYHCSIPCSVWQAVLFCFVYEVSWSCSKYKITLGWLMALVSNLIIESTTLKSFCLFFCCKECSFLFPILERALQVWNPSTQKNVMKLGAIQLCAHAACWVAPWQLFEWSKPSQVIT